ncbi:tail protein X [Hafnia paralvei]|uniref:tail protein X n=1 Tax=Hafnia TaxID=568 RepID=UPI001FFF877F|nr:tail protein X [Hafnia paralvei]MCK2180197.1 tail protein X [Hafnia paralvei]
MPTTYQTREGDMLDAICAVHYSWPDLGEVVVLVLDANPGLADLGAVYDAGVIITLPDLDTPVATSPLQLWD